MRGNEKDDADREQDHEDHAPVGETENPAAENRGENRRDAADGSDERHDRCERFATAKVGGNASRENDTARCSEALDESKGDKDPDARGGDAERG